MLERGRPTRAGSGVLGAGAAGGWARRRPPMSTAVSPSAAQSVSVSSALPAPLPSKKATDRSSEPPAPGGISRPIVPIGRGSSSGALVTPEKGFPSSTISRAPRSTPGGPISAASPATVPPMAPGP